MVRDARSDSACERRMATMGELWRSNVKKRPLSSTTVMEWRTTSLPSKMAHETPMSAWKYVEFELVVAAALCLSQ
jgi:hypothetical protein